MPSTEGKSVLANGTFMQVQEPLSSQWLTIAGLTDYNGPQSSRGEIEVTELGSAAKEYVADLKDNGTFTATVRSKLGTASQKLLFAGLDAKSPYQFRLVLPDDGLGNGAVTINFKAFVTAFPLSGGVGQVISTALSLRITGDINIIYPGGGQKILTMTPNILAENAAGSGQVHGTPQLILENEAFTGSDGAALPGVSFSGLPGGLSAAVTRTSSTRAKIVFSGAIASHAAGSGFQVEVSCTDDAFAGGAANTVVGAGNTISINFV